jgi:hypothetical protein
MSTNKKSLARLRAILKTATLAAIASSATASAATTTTAPTTTPAARLPAAAEAPMPFEDTDDVESLAHQLAARLTDLPPMEAVGASADLATSHDPRERIVLAGALAWVFPLASDDILLQHLADDPDPRVRAAIARAAWARMSVVGDTGILRRLLGDSDADVRAAAWHAVRG